VRNILLLLAIIGVAAGCNNDRANDQGHSTPIDSTNLNATAPATYGGDNPANSQDTVYANSNDTGTRASNGPDSVQHKRTEAGHQRK
jgi:hypothetical protein